MIRLPRSVSSWFGPVGRNAFDTAVEVVGEGFKGEAALAEWMSRIESLGQRYCALALDIILGAGVDQEAAPAEEQPEPLNLEEMYDPLFDRMFVFDSVPGEPVEY